MKKRVLSLLLAMVFVVGVLSACGTKKISDNGDTTQETNNENNENKDEQGDTTSEETANIIHLYKICTNDFETGERDGGYITKAHMHYEKMALMKDDEDKYPELKSALEKFGTSIESMAKDEYEQCKEAADADIDNIPDEGFFTERYVNVRRADDCVVTISSSYSYYSGGAHPYGGDWPVSIDVKTGKELKLGDVVKDVDAMYEYVTAAIKEKYADYLDEFFNINDDDPFAGFKSGEYTQGFAVDYDGLTIIFNPYDIAAYAAGQQIIKIPYKGHEDILEGKYFEKVPESYIIEVENYSEYDIDIDNDGVIDSFLAAPYYDDYIFNGINFVINNNSYAFENGNGDEYIDAFSGRNFIYKTKGGKLFYYFMGCGENGYTTFNMFEITKDGFTKPTAFDCDIAYPTDGNEILPDYSWVDGCITDPDKCMMQYRTDMFGTNSVVRMNHFEENGNIVPDEDIFTFVSNAEYKVLKSIKVEIVDENYNKTGERELEVGEEVRPYKTNNKDTVYLLDKDGNMLKINETCDWPHQVDGIDIDTIFDGILYAG